MCVLISNTPEVTRLVFLPLAEKFEIPRPPRKKGSSDGIIFTYDGVPNAFKRERERETKKDRGEKVGRFCNRVKRQAKGSNFAAMCDRDRTHTGDEVNCHEINRRRKMPARARVLWDLLRPHTTATALLIRFPPGESKKMKGTSL